VTTTEAPAGGRLLTIGAVCTRLKDEFPDISISKIRYLEDQGLLSPSASRRSCASSATSSCRCG
jgi:hypothetical protein